MLDCQGLGVVNFLALLSAGVRILSQSSTRLQQRQWLAAITAAENADSRREEVFQRDSDEEFYAELWGLPLG